jgi:hypothetical protein
LLSAIRKDTRVSLSNDDILDTVCDVMDEGLDAPAHGGRESSSGMVGKLSDERRGQKRVSLWQPKYGRSVNMPWKLPKAIKL